MRLVYLSDAFYDEFESCGEILKKRNRPYACLAVQIDGVLYAIPLRHHVEHKYGFITFGKCGLDYSKAVVIRSRADIGPGSPHINQAEYNMIKGREAVIARGMRNYVKLYKTARQYPGNKHYSNILAYSTLKYFERYI